MSIPAAIPGSIQESQASQGEVISPREAPRAGETNHAGMLEATALLASVVDAIDEVIITKTLDGVITSWNAAAETIYGYSAAEMIGRPISGLMPPEHQDEMTIILAKIRAGERIEHYQTTWVRKDGRPIATSLTISPVYDAGGGRLIGASTVGRDITGRKRAQEALRRSEERFWAVFNSVADGVVVANAATTEFLFGNQALSQMLGCAHEELSALTVRDIHPPKDLPTVMEAFEKLARNEIQMASGLPVQRKDGSVFYADITARAISVEGEPRLVGIFHDVTERKRAETALEESRELLSLYLRRSPLCTYIKEVSPTESRVVEASDIFQDIIGIPAQEMIGKTTMELFPPELAAQMTADDRAVVSAGAVLQLEEDFNGRSYSTIKFPIIQGEKKLVAGYSIDITDRKRAEEALRKSEAKYRIVAENTNDWEFWLDAERRFVYVSPSCESITGYTCDQFMADASLLAALIHADDLPDYKRHERAVVASPGPCELEFRVLRPDGTARWLEHKCRPLYDEEGRFLGTRGSNRDITERKQAREVLRQSEEQLRQAHKMQAVGQLAGGIAHDFNNLLTAVIGNSDLVLQTMAPDDPNRELVADIKEVGERAAGLTRQILAFSRRQMLKPEVLCLNQVVTRLEPLLRRTLGENVRVQTRLAPDLRSTKVDPGQMEQVLMNLAINGRDAMPQGGELIIETANILLDRAYCKIHAELKPGRHVLLAVYDTGCGMDQETQSRIFEPFFSTKDVGKGTGLGLSTVFGIVAQSGGSISVHSELGKGTALRIYLPIHKGAETLEDDHAPEHELTKGTETVLVVEDEASVRELIARVLARSGYRVLEAGSATEASAVLTTKGPTLCLLISDMSLPGGKSGLEVAEEIRLRRPGLPVLFISGYTQDSALFNGSLGKDAHFLEKPFSTGALLQEVRKALDQKARGVAGRPPRREAHPVGLCAGTGQV